MLKVIEDIDRLLGEGKSKAILKVLKAEITKNSSSSELWFALSKILSYTQQPSAALMAKEQANHLSQLNENRLVATKIYSEESYLEENEAQFNQVEQIDYFEYEQQETRQKPKVLSLNKIRNSSTPCREPDNNNAARHQVTIKKKRSIASSASTLEAVGSDLSDIETSCDDLHSGSITQHIKPVIPQANIAKAVTISFPAIHEASSLTKSSDSFTGSDTALRNEHSDYLDSENFKDDHNDDYEVLNPTEFNLDDFPTEDLEFDYSYNLSSTEQFDDYSNYEDIEYHDNNPSSIDNLFDPLITPEQKSIQVAARFIRNNDWGHNLLDTLSVVFCNRGYGRQVSVLEAYISEGLTEAEFMLAFELRDIWKEDYQYSIQFFSNGESDSRYFILSWSIAIKFIRKLTEEYSGSPSVEELQHSLETIYDTWFNNDPVKQIYRSFSIYFHNYVHQLDFPNNHRFIYDLDSSMEGYGSDEFVENNLYNSLLQYGFNESDVGLTRYLAY